MTFGTMSFTYCGYRASSTSAFFLPWRAVQRDVVGESQSVPFARKRSVSGVFSYRFSPYAMERSGLSAKRIFQSLGVSSATREAGCRLTR